MKFLHTMVRVKNLDESLDFYCNKLGLIQVKRTDYEEAKFSLIFLAASEDENSAKDSDSPTIELTYNWPDENGKTEDFTSGRNFGHLAFRVDDIFEKCKQLQEHGIVINRPPRDGYMAFLKSPDGVSIELLQKGEALTPIEPWKSMENTGTW